MVETVRKKPMVVEDCLRTQGPPVGDTALDPQLAAAVQQGPAGGVAVVRCRQVVR